MKKLTGIICTLAFTVSLLTSCKDKEAESVDTTTTTTKEVPMASEPDTTSNSNVVNDTNVSGTTSGKMEQVP